MAISRSWALYGVVCIMLVACGAAPKPIPPMTIKKVWEGYPEPFEWGLYGREWKSSLDLPPIEA